MFCLKFLFFSPKFSSNHSFSEPLPSLKILQMNEMQVISQLVKHFQEHVDLPGEACQAVKPQASPERSF